MDDNCPTSGIPVEDCLSCLGEACRLCGAGCWNLSVTDCTHDVAERHLEKEYENESRVRRIRNI